MDTKIVEGEGRSDTINFTITFKHSLYSLLVIELISVHWKHNEYIKMKPYDARIDDRRQNI